MKRAEVITKRIRSPTALRKVFRPDVYFSVRQNLIYSSYRTRGRKYQPTPHIDRKKRQRSKDYEPQKRVTLVQRKPVPCFSKILSKGQCRARLPGPEGGALLDRVPRKPQYQWQYFGLGMNQNNDCGGCDDICSIDLLSALWPYSPVHVCPHYPGTHGAHA